MSSVVKVLEIVMPIFATIALGMWAKKKNKMSEEANKGLQQFVMTFCLPCVLLNSCLTGNFGVESFTAMVLVMPLVFLSVLWAFRARKKKYPYDSNYWSNYGYWFFNKPILRSDVLEMKDLKPGMSLKGTVRNVIDFGVFVDIGVHQDGLVHI